MQSIKKKKLVFKNQVYKVYSNYIKSKHYVVKDYLSLEVNGKKFGGVCCIIIVNKKIGLMKIYSPILKKKLFSLVQGFCDKNEAPLNAIKREILEETGINVDKKNINYLNKIFPMHSLIKSQLGIYYANLKYYNPVDLKKRVKEVGTGKINFYSFQEIKKMIKKPHHFDLISYTAIVYYFIINKFF